MTKPKPKKEVTPDRSFRKEHWKDQPDEHDYPSAGDYLSLLANPASCDSLVAWLRVAPVTRHKAKDILRASRLELLPLDNPHVALDLGKVRKGEKLSPVLLVRGALEFDVPLVIADGYHRVCASYHIDENADIPCRMTSLGDAQ